MAEKFENIEGVGVVVDDILVWGETKEQHDARLIQVLEQAQAHHLTLNKLKGKRLVGHIHTQQGKFKKKTEPIKPYNKEQL